MLQKKHLLEFIGSKLAYLKAAVATLNEIRFFDLNVVAEDFFADLLNAVYGLSLVNLNHEGLNAVAIDLGDATHRIAVQVTSERTKVKIQTTLDSFSQHDLAANFDALKVLIIGDRTGDYPTLTVPEGVTFSARDDVLDIGQLIKDIARLPVERLHTIADLIRREVQDPSTPFPIGGSTPGALEQIGANQEEILKQQAEHTQQTSRLFEAVNEVQGAVAAMSTTMLPDALASVHQASLDVARDLLKANQPSQAIALLERQKPSIWSTASGPIRARLLCTIAAAKLTIGAESEAAHLFLEARQYNPNDEKVLTNVAIGYFFLGDKQKAADTARLVLERNPANFQAYAILVQASPEPLDNIIRQLPQFCLTNSEVALAIGFTFRQGGDLKTASHWLRIAAKNDPDNNLDIKGMLAETILHVLITTPTSPLRIRQPDAASRSDLEEAVALFHDACNASDDPGVLRIRITWFVNAAIALRMLGRLQDAEQYLIRANRITPDDPHVIFQSAVLAHDRGNLDEAIGLARKLGTPTDIPNAPLLLADLLWEAHQYDDAIRVLLAFVETKPAAVHAQSARQLLVEMYMETGRLSEAVSLSEEVLTADPSDVSSLVIASQLYRSLSEADKAEASLAKALQYVNEATPSNHFLLLGNALGFLGRWSEASDILARIVDVTSDSPLTRKYLNACYRASKLDKVLAICQDLRQRHGSLEYVTDLEIAVLDETGDLSGARSLSEQMAAAYPSDGRRRVLLGVICLRAHDDEALDGLLDSPPDWQLLPVECGQQLAALYAARKRYRDAVKLLYEIRRVHNANGAVHLQYLQTFLFQDDEKHEWLDVQSVGPDVAVAVKDSSGDVQWYIIEDREDVDIAKGELPTTHRLAQELAGKSPGEKVLLKESSLSSERGTIDTIKSKYLHAFHESAKVLEVRFPEQACKFISLKLPEGPEGIKELFQKLGEDEDRREQRNRLVLSLYRNNPLPIGASGAFPQSKHHGGMEPRHGES